MERRIARGRYARIRRWQSTRGLEASTTRPTSAARCLDDGTGLSGHRQERRNSANKKRGFGPLRAKSFHKRGERLAAKGEDDLRPPEQVPRNSPLAEIWGRAWGCQARQDHEPADATKLTSVWLRHLPNLPSPG